MKLVGVGRGTGVGWREANGGKRETSKIASMIKKKNKERKHVVVKVMNILCVIYFGRGASQSPNLVVGVLNNMYFI